MLTASLMKSMSSEHLAAAARVECDSLTSTALEIELLDRLEALLDAQSRTQPVADLLDEWEVGTSDLKALFESHPEDLKGMRTLLALLNDEDIHEPEQLEELIGFAAKFRALAKDAGDFFTRLTDLITAHKE